VIANLPLPAIETITCHNGLCTFRPCGRYSLVDAVDLVSGTIAFCRKQSVNMLLVDATGLVDLPVPSLADRFLMIEDWASEAAGTVIVAMVIRAEYIDPRKFGVNVAQRFGLAMNVHTSEEEALAWLSQASSNRRLNN